MLRKIRRLLSVVTFLLITFLFLDFTGSLHLWFGWLAKIQLIPAILAVNVGAIVFLAILTLVFGRLYCSIICPLGIFQDLVSNISARRKKKRNRFRYSKAKTWLRYGILIIFIISILAGVNALVSILDPYSAYGRMAGNFFAPLYRLGNNLLALGAERLDSYAFYSTDVWVKGWVVFGIAVVTLATIVVLAWRHGRTYCNTICPVGTFLGFISKYSFVRMTFVEDKCIKCNACAKGCKSSCIDVKNLNIDHSRCVTCFNCIDKCKSGAMEFKLVKLGKKKETGVETLPVSNLSPTEEINGDFTRRNMLTLFGTIAVGGTIRAQQLKVDGGLADIVDKKIPERKTPIVPPGAISAKNMKNRCTACQLCVSACPNNILRPSGNLVTFMQPEMSYERGYCRPECVECSLVCPAAAIKPITTAEKTAISIGTAVWIKDNCIVNRDEVQCDNCQRHCPTGAITLVARDPENEGSLKIPVVDKSLCIGCGACENLCPARPFSAIYVEGNVRHHTI